MQQVKLISVAAVLSLLIWTTANQLISDTVEIPVTVVAEPVGDTGLIVEAIPQEGNRFMVTFSGPKRLVDRLRVDGKLSVRIPFLEDSNVPLGPRPPIDVQRELEDQAEQFYGLHVEKVNPPRIALLIDRRRTVTMPVQVDPGNLQYEVPPAVEPAEVEVTIRELALAELAGQQRVVLEVESLLRDAPKGEPQELAGVRLPTRIADVAVSVEPATVKLFATLRDQTTTATIPAVPVLWAASLETFNGYRLQTRDGSTLITRAITVRGPVAVVERLVEGSTRVTGVVVLTGDLVAQTGQFDLEPVFDLPPGVELVEPVEPVKFELVTGAEPVAP